MAASKRKKKVTAKGKGRAKAANGGTARKKRQDKARELSGGAPGAVGLGVDINQFRQAQAKGTPAKSQNTDVQAFLETLSPDELAQLQRQTEARQGATQLFGKDQSLFDRGVGAVVPGAALVWDALKSVEGFGENEAGRKKSLLENFGGLHDDILGGTAGRDISTPGPATSTDNRGNFAATIEGFRQGLRDTGTNLSPTGRPSRGGSLAHKAEASGRNIGRQKFASGGATLGGSPFNPQAAIPGPRIDGTEIPGISTLPGLEQGNVTQQNASGTSAGTSETTQSSSGTGFTQNSADTGALDNIVQKLQGLQGHSNLGRGTLDEILNTGLPTDVSGITAAAKIRAGQEFDDAQNVIGERLANLGLVSSSAQTTAVAREKAKLGERIAAAGMEAEVAAAEAAAGRRQGAVSQDNAGQNTRAGALGSAGSLAGQSAGLNSRQDTGFNTTGQTNTTTTGSTTSQGTTSQSAPTAGTLPGSSRPGGFTLGGGSGRNQGGGRGPSPLAGRGGPKALYSPSLGGYVSNTQGGSTGTNFRTGQRLAKGGMVAAEDTAFENWLQNQGADLTEGGVQIIGLGGKRGAGADATRRNQTLAQFGGEDAARMLFENPDAFARFVNEGKAFMGKNEHQSLPSRGNMTGAQLAALSFGQKFQPANLKNHPSDLLDFRSERAPGVSAGAPNTRGVRDTRVLSDARDQGLDPTGIRGSAQNRQFFGDGGPVEAPNKGAIPQPGLPQENGQLVPGLLDPRRQFFEEGGGVAPGIDSGEDKVPAMLRSEELVVTPELTEELMNVDPGLPQPGLITALQQLAEQPLEFGEEEGEFVAADGGRVHAAGGGISNFADPSPRPPGSTFSLPALLAFLGQQNVEGEVGFNPGDDIVTGPEVPQHRDLGVPGPSARRLHDGMAEGHQDFTQPSFAPPDDPFDFGGVHDVPSDPFRAPSFSESVGEAGERKFTLDGGSPDAGRVGEAGIRAGLDPSAGRVSGGEGLFPGATPIEPGGKGVISGSATITDPETGLPMDFGGEQLSRLERAQRTADLTRAAISSDPVGGPQKQARMLRALEIANREVDASVNEIVKGQQIAIQRQQAANNAVVANAQLNESVSRRLSAEASKVTAEGALAQQVLEAQAHNPVVTDAMNKLELLAKNPDMHPEDRDRIIAILNRELESQGIQLAETGFWASLFGPSTPGFEVSPVQPQQGIPTQDGAGREGFANGGLVGDGAPAPIADDGNQELQSLMSRAKAGMSAEDFQHIMEMM